MSALSSPPSLSPDSESAAASHAAHYAALTARDRRFDGHFFVGVTSTRIYCRPVCSVRVPKPENCRFYPNAAAAEAHGFRPCLRCRPELAPGCAPVDASARLAWAAAQDIEAGEHDIARVAQRLDISTRHLRRVFTLAFGVAPVAYAQTQRLLMAKRLLADTRLSITEAALAAGFGSLSRFNTLFRARYGLAPSAMRRAGPLLSDGANLRFELAYRPPFDWPHLLEFLSKRCVAGVEAVTEDSYRRTVRIVTDGVERLGWLELTHVEHKNAVAVVISASLLRGLAAVLARVKRLCDLACDPSAVAAVLGPLAAEAPGLRVPGAFDGFEMAVRAVLGQQVTVKAAHTIAGRLVAAFGHPLATPFEALTHVFPSPDLIAAQPVERIAALGIVRTRATAIQALAIEIAANRLDLGPTADVPATVARLEALPGIGPWTAQYIALRALSWPDAWPTGDVVLIKALGAANARAADLQAQAWRPWRAYATLHLWRRGPQRSTGEH